MSLSPAMRLLNAGWRLADCECCWTSPWAFLDAEPIGWDTDEAIAILDGREAP